MLAAGAAWALADTPSVQVPGLIAFFGGAFVLGLAAGVFAVRRGDPYLARAAVALLGLYLPVGAYTAARTGAELAGRPLWQLLLYLTLLILFAQLHAYQRLAHRLAVAEGPVAESSRRAFRTLLAKMVGGLALVYALSLFFVAAAADVHLGTTDVVVGFALILASLAAVAALALLGSRRRSLA